MRLNQQTNTSQHQGKMVTDNKQYHRGVRVLFLVLSWWLIFFFAVDITSGQDNDLILVQPPETENFPNISVQFKIKAQTNPIDGDLQPEQFTLVENEQRVPIVSLEPSYQGVHFTLAINGGRDLDVRDFEGRSPYQKITDFLSDWANSRTFASQDAWSFVTNEGVGIRNTVAPQAWATAMAAYQPNFRLMEPDLTSLETAIQLANERVVAFGVDKALLYITPPPTPDQIDPIRSLTEIARAGGIQISVWMVGDGYFLTNDQGGSLIDMAAITGGQFFHYTGVETLPDPETMLASLGIIYSLTYESSITQTGTYSLRITADFPQGQISGESSPFYIGVEPPKPILVSPPTKITHYLTNNAETPPNTDLQPIVFRIIIEFPDSYTREIKNSRLYVDNQLIDERSSPPFDALIWDITRLTETDNYVIEVEVEDTLGLSSRTIPTIIEVAVISTEPSPTESADSQLETGLIFVGIILSAAGIIFLIWLIRRLWQSEFFKQATERFFRRHKSGVSNHPEILDSSKKAYARLIPVNTFNRGSEKQTHRLVQPEFYVGCDNKRAGLVLADADIDPMHAFFRQHNGSFWLNDLDSNKGTWVNYTKIGSKPVEVHPGDVIHFGKIGFRFTITEDKKKQPIKQSKYEPA